MRRNHWFPKFVDESVRFGKREGGASVASNRDSKSAIDQDRSECRA